MATTIGIDDKDLGRFVKAKLAYSAKAGKDVSSADFFTKVLDYWIDHTDGGLGSLFGGKNHEGKTK